MQLFLGKDPADPSLHWLEDHIQMYIVQQSKKAGYDIAADFNAGKRNHSKAKAMGLLPGVPDIRYYFNSGLIVWIELKAAKTVFRPEQKEHHAMLKRRGHTVFMVRATCPVDGWQQVQAILKNYDAMR